MELGSSTPGVSFDARATTPRRTELFVFGAWGVFTLALLAVATAVHLLVATAAVGAPGAWAFVLGFVFPLLTLVAAPSVGRHLAVGVAKWTRVESPVPAPDAQY